MISWSVETRSRYVIFFNDTATTEIYTLSLHDALPIFLIFIRHASIIDNTLPDAIVGHAHGLGLRFVLKRDRKSTRLNSSHANISYAVFCLKKKLFPAVLSTPQSSPPRPDPLPHFLLTR